MSPIRVMSLLAILSHVLLAGCAPPESTQPAPSVAQLPGVLPQITAARFPDEVLDWTQPVLVEVGVDSGCYLCQTMKPRIADVVRQFAGQAKVVRVDFRSEAALVQQLGVKMCPTYLVFDNGQVVDSIVGETPTPMLSAKLASAVDRSKSRLPGND